MTLGTDSPDTLKTSLGTLMKRPLGEKGLLPALLGLEKKSPGRQQERDWTGAQWRTKHGKDTRKNWNSK